MNNIEQLLEVRDLSQSKEYSEEKLNPLVSICCLTFNHESYIEQCIEGMMMQKTNFTFEILIHDDASTDQTIDIIKEYTTKYPDIIKPIYRQENQHSKGVKGMTARFNIARAKGKYIAMCEGDDYWIDPYKLQKQVDFMENNTNYSLVYHKVLIYNEKEEQYSPEFFNTLKDEKTYSIVDLAKGNFIHTQSILFRKDAFDLEYFVRENMFLDYSYWMLCAENGLIKYLPDTMAVYRVWGGSMWELRDNNFKTSQMLMVLIPLLNKFCDNEEVYSILFNQLRLGYTKLYSGLKDNDEENILDNTTKKILLNLKYIQFWWFSYMIHVKASRLYRLKYFIYLVRRRSLASIHFFKKSIY